MNGPREEVVKLRCTAEEKMRFQELARAENTDVSTLIRRRVFGATAEAPSLFGETSNPLPEIEVSGPAVQHYSGTTSGPGWPE